LQSKAQNKQILQTKNKNCMRTHNYLTKVTALAAIVFTGITISCQENEVPVAQQNETSYVVEESMTDVYYEDADDLAGLAISADTRTAGGRLSSDANVLVDDRLCAGVVITFTLSVNATLDHPIGDIVIDFGTTGCTDPRGNVRTGKIKVHFDGRRFLTGSSVTITFDNYTINQIALNGTRTLTNITGSTENLPKFRVELTGTIVWPDGTDASRSHCFEREWNRGVLENLADDQLVVTQCPNVAFAAEGTNRRGVSYTMTIQEPLVYKRGCPIAVSGIKVFTQVSTGKQIIIDYGDGTCDRMITITVEGSTRTVEAKHN
jgi:hypothetical protein